MQIRNQINRDETIDPAYLARMNVPASSSGSGIPVADFNALKIRVSNLESSQAVQDRRLNGIDDDIEDIKEQLSSIGTTTTIINYITTVIGKTVPEEIAKDPAQLEEWLKAQDEDGIDLASLSKRIKEIEENIITIEDIEDLFG